MTFYSVVIALGMCNFFLELTLMQFALMFNVKKRKYFYLRILIIVAAGVGFYFLPNLIVLKINISYLIVFAGVSLIGWFLFDIPLSTAIYYAVSSFAFQHITWNVMFTIFEGYPAFSLSNTSLYLLTYMFSFFVVGIGILVVNLIIKKDQNSNKPNFVSFIISGFIIFVVFLMSQFVALFYSWTPLYRIYTILTTVFALLVQYGVFSITGLGKKKEELEKENATLEKMLAIQGHQQALTKETIDAINLKCHDLKNQINALRTLDEEEREANLQEIEKSLNVYGDIAKTGNDVLDIVLTDKSLICSDRKIRFTYIINTYNIDFIKPTDLAVLLGNALDNSIEAVSKLDEEYRTIRMQINSQKGFVCIHIENYYNGKIDVKNGEIVTKKKNKINHGYGLKSINFIAQKYNGNMNISTNNSLFSLDILIPFSKDNN